MRPAPAPETRPASSPAAIWALAGGKGGVGRTLLAANMGIQMARLGKRVIAADLDLQGPSLHAYLGFARAPRTLQELLQPEAPPLSDLLLDTSVSGLKLLAGVRHSLEPPDRARLLERFLDAAGSLPAEVVLLDCGSGRSVETLDLFRASGLGVLITSPEPAACESLHLFTGSLLQRTLERDLPAEDREKLAIAESLAQEASGGRPSLRSAVERLRREAPDTCERILEALKAPRLRLILNQIRGEADAEIGVLLQSGFESFFGLDLRPMGCVEYDLSVLQSVQKRKPLAQQYPNSPATQGIERAVSTLLGPAGNRVEALPLSRDLDSMDYYHLLGLPPGATSKEIQQSYQILKRTYDPEGPLRHPEISPGEVARVAGLMESAYRTLIFLESRSEYDRKLVEEGVLRPEQVRPPEPVSAVVATPAEPSAETDTVSGVPVSARDDGQGPGPDPARTPGKGLPVTGATLRARREERNLSLDIIVERTKIRPSILEALEADRFTDLPEPVFLRGFLRQLAVCLGLDPTVVSREYMERFLPSSRTSPRRSR